MRMSCHAFHLMYQRVATREIPHLIVLIPSITLVMTGISRGGRDQSLAKITELLKSLVRLCL